jgi:3-deoxy-D-manno-octulosonic-acid transferase
LFLYSGIRALFYPETRKSFKHKWGVLKISRSKNRSPLWIHAVSSGEVVSTLPLIREIKKLTEREIIISTGTAAGFSVASQKLKEVEVIFFPFDFSWVVGKVLKKINPALVIIIEVEIWPNFLRQAHRLKVPVVMINGRIYKKDFHLYRYFSFFFKQVLGFFTFCGMQTEEDKRRLVEIGRGSPKKVIVCGNTKLDVILQKKDRFGLLAELKIPPQRLIIVAGSTHKGEDSIFLKVYKNIKQRYPQVSLIIAPRHLERVGRIEQLCTNLNLSFCRRTQIRKDREVIILDTMGELAKIYLIADIVFIGGSLVRVGGHNLIEPALLAKPVLFGPYMENFEETKSLLLAGEGALEVKTPNELEEKLLFLLEDEEERKKLGTRAYEIIKENQGVVEKYLDLIKKWL